MPVSSRLCIFAEKLGEQCWRNKTDEGVVPLLVIENLDVFLEQGPGLSTGGITTMMDKLIFERSQKLSMDTLS